MRYLSSIRYKMADPFFVESLGLSRIIKKDHKLPRIWYICISKYLHNNYIKHFRVSIHRKQLRPLASNKITSMFLPSRAVRICSLRVWNGVTRCTLQFSIFNRIVFVAYFISLNLKPFYYIIWHWCHHRVMNILPYP